MVGSVLPGAQHPGARGDNIRAPQGLTLFDEERKHLWLLWEVGLGGLGWFLGGIFRQQATQRGGWQLSVLWAVLRQLLTGTGLRLVGAERGFPGPLCCIPVDSMCLRAGWAFLPQSPWCILTASFFGS